MPPTPLLSKAWTTFNYWREACHQRSNLRKLLKLSDHMLKDIGIRRVDAEREANRPLWDVELRRDFRLREPPQSGGWQN